MREYSYIAKNKEGEAVNGLVEAESESAAAKLLLSKNIYVVDILPKKEKSFSILDRVSVKDKALFARQLATMINAGLPISQALTTLGQQSGNVKLKSIVDTVSKDVEAGSQLSVSLAKFPAVFKTIDTSLIATGEASGTLDKTLLRLADQTEKTYKINKKIRSAFTYPAFILLVVAGVITLMVVYVMPQMESLYSSFNAKLPLLTRVMIAISHVLTNYGLIVIIGLAGLLIFLQNMIRRPRGRKVWDNFKLRMPLFGQFLVKVYIARFSRTLAGLVSSGVPLIDSLRIVSEVVGSTVFKETIMDAAEKVKSGIPLSTPLKESEHFPLIVAQMISVGEKTGELDHMLDNLADYYEEEVENMVKNFSSLLEPIIIVVMGIIVGVLLISIMMPIYGLGKVIFK